MMTIGNDIFLQPFPRFYDGFHPYMLETGYLPVQGISFAQQEELCEECLGVFVPSVNDLFLVKSLFRLPQ